MLLKVDCNTYTRSLATYVHHCNFLMDFLQHEGCKTVGFEKSIWKVTVTIDGHHILLGVHIDEFVIAMACANFPVLHAFHKRLLETF